MDFILKNRFRGFCPLGYKWLMPDPRAIEELKTLYRKHFQITLTDEQAKKEAADLIFIYAFSQGRLHELPALQIFEDS